MFELEAKDFEQVVDICRSKEGGQRAFRAHVLRLKHKNYSPFEIADILEITPRTVYNVMKYYEQGGLEKALHDDPRPGRPRILDDRDKCRIISMVCTQPPEGFDRWSLSLIAEEAVKRKLVPSISREKCRIILHEHDLKPWKEKMWCIPEVTKEYKERMEKILDLYSKKHTEQSPLLCVDEKTVPFTEDKIDPLPTKPGSIKKKDYQYHRNGSANVFFAIEPQKGVYGAKVTKTRKREDFAEFLAELAHEYANAHHIYLVLDNLNIHCEKSLIMRYGEEKGGQIWKRFRVFYTPKHGSWLNQAEIGIGMYSRQCLGSTRIGDLKSLKKKTQAWIRYINAKAPTVNWRFKTQDARKIFS